LRNPSSCCAHGEVMGIARAQPISRAVSSSSGAAFTEQSAADSSDDLPPRDPIKANARRCEPAAHEHAIARTTLQARSRN
jgi:hypothetical protein